MIDTSTGYIWFLKGTACLYPRMALDEFQSSPLFPMARKIKTLNERFNTLYSFGPLELIGAQFSFWCFFENNTLTTIHVFSSSRPPLTWFMYFLFRIGLYNGMSAEESVSATKKDKAFNDGWLQRTIGQSSSIKHYPSWGEIRSEHDELRDGAWISINYA